MAMVCKLDGTVIDPSRFGSKNHYLAYLIAADHRVPATIALEVGEGLAPDDLTLLARERSNESMAVAVRSSAVDEDSDDQSLAGSYRTHLNLRGFERVVAAVADVRRHAGPAPMGVAVQRMVDAEFSGVAFSVDPTSYESATVVVSWIYGLGSRLVSGTEVGHDVRVDKDSGVISSGHWAHGSTLLSEIVSALANLSEHLARPVDIEWCVERDSGHLYLLQLRPVVLPRPTVIDLRQPGAFEQLPAIVIGHPKLQLRRKAAVWGIPMTPAQVAIGNIHERPSVGFIDRSSSAEGSSVVLLHPFVVNRRVIREFAKTSDDDIEFFTAECRRYSIRRYPSTEDIPATISRVLSKGIEVAAVAAVLEQEIWQARITGIVRPISDGYLIEVGLGHFIPKGYVKTSTYVVSNDLRVRSKREVSQQVAYHFFNGHVVKERDISENPWLREAEIVAIIMALRPFFEEEPDLALEFGLADRGQDEFVYLIDAAESDDPEVSLDSSSFDSGIVAHGKAAGLVVDLRRDDVREDFNAHFFQRVLGDAPLGPTIFIAERASVDLLSLLYACPPGCGFVFEQASLLAHLAVVLRERGVPGVVLGADQIGALIKASSAMIDTRQSVTVRPISDIRAGQ